jgi:hypothetical protein
MKLLIVSFAIWLFIVPAVVALFLIFTFLAAYNPDLYPALASLALAFSIVTMVWGRSWLEPFFSPSFRFIPKSRQRKNSIQENKYEKCVEGHVRS